MKKNSSLKKMIAVIVNAIILMSCLVGCGVGLPGSTEMPNDGTDNLLPSSSEPFATGFLGTHIPLTDGDATEKPPEIRKSTIYYLTDEGYIYPVSVDVPWEEGIAKACLNCLVDTVDNRLTLQKQGLNAVIPDGTGIELNISNGHATVNLVDMPQLDSAEDEMSMFVSIVNTLTEFSSIETVSILFDGKDGNTPNGNGIPKNQGPYRLNVEPNEIATSGTAKPITLYFPNEEGSLNIPVTRYVEGSIDLYACISSLAAGTQMPGLRSCFPANTLVLAATIENDVLSINLSSDFESIAETPGLYELAYNMVFFTGKQFGSINEVRFFVNGERFEP